MANDGRLRVLTLNAWGIPFVSKDRAIRITCIAEELSKSLYDIVALQEIWSYSDYEFISEKVQSVLPYSHYFHSGVIGSGVCVFSHYPIVDVISFRYFPNGYIYKIHHGDWFGGKALGLCVIEHPKQLIHFFATHLHASYPGESYIHHRVSQAYQMSRYIQHAGPQSGVTLLCGDMNCSPSDLGYRIIRDVAHLKDAWLDHADKQPYSGNTCDVSHNSYTSYKAGTTVVGGPKDGQRIDYIFYRGNGDDIKCTDCEVTMGRIPGTAMSFSDHEGVSATFLLKESSPEFPEVRSKSEYSAGTSTTTLVETRSVLSEGIRLHSEGSIKKILTICALVFVIAVPLFLSRDGLLGSQSCLVHITAVLSAVLLAVHLYYVIFNAYEEVSAYRSLQKMIEIQIKRQRTDT